MNDNGSANLGSADAFGQFVSNQYSSSVLLVVILGDFLFNILSFNDWPLAGGALIGGAVDEQSSLYGYLRRISFTVRMAAFCSLWFVWWFKPVMHVRSPRGVAAVIVSYAVPIVQAVFPVLMSCAFSYQAIREMTGSSETALYIAPAVSMPVLGLQLYPVVVFLLLKDTQLAAIAASWAIGVVTLAVISIRTQSWDHLYMLIGYVALSSVLIYHHHRSSRAVFQLVSRLQCTLAENARLEVEARAEELRAMIGNVAHDLKTPLTSFLGGIECMQSILDPWEALLTTGQNAAFACKATDNFASMRHCLRTMICTNTFMAMTINRCVDYTKASKGIKLVPMLATVVLQRKIDIAVRLIRDANSDVEIVVGPIHPDICSHIITDRQWLIENILCLPSNAVKYSNRNHVELAVHLQGGSEPELSADCDAARCLRFEVLDAGVGLSEEAMHTLFNPFKQAQRLAGGTGLGLFSLAKRVEALHGQYGVQRRPDGAQGCLFWFTIPYRPDNESAQMLQAAVEDCAEALAAQGELVAVDDRLRPPLVIDCGSAEPTLRSPSGQALTVLIVDDSALVVKMTAQLLRQKGHRVTDKVMNGAEGLERILQDYDTVTGVPPFDVVLMDLQMPVLDGIEAIRRLRAQEQIMEAHIGEWKQELVDGKGDGAEVVARPVAGVLLPSELVSPPSRKPAPSPASARRRRCRMNYHQFVIALSANSDHETQQEAFAAGADAFLAKPFTYDAFREMVR